MSSPNVKLVGRFALFLLAGLCSSDLVAQDRVPSEGDGGGTQIPILLGSTEEDLNRLDHLRGTPSAGFLLRSLSTQMIWREAEGPKVTLIAPSFQAVWNSAIPDSRNEGVGWSGRGWNTVVTSGGGFGWGPISVIIAPQFAYSQNHDFEIVSDQLPPRSEFALPWFVDTLSVDMPVRFGDQPHAFVSPGQSSASIEVGQVLAGVSTENHWWGPGIRNALVLSNNATGFPHAFARSSRPWRSPIGAWEWVWIAGELSGSDYFDPTAADQLRSLSGFAATFSPAGLTGLHVGVARTVYAARDGSRSRFASAADVFLDWSGANELTRDDRERPSEQITSLFGRWVFPKEGVEVYGEWARYRLPLSIRDFLEQPNHSQGYTIGGQWVKGIAPDLRLKLQAEVTNVERSATYRLRPIGSFYTSLELPHGYTHEGKVLGAAIGPGSSSQWIAADLIGKTYRVGLFGGRTRWNNDAYFRRLAPWLFFGHDVSLMTGIRGGIDWQGVRLDFEYSRMKRLNFLFQNWGTSWDRMDDAVDITNRTVRIGLTTTVPITS